VFDAWGLGTVYSSHAATTDEGFMQVEFVRAPELGR
jgi:hypothetical protein